MVLPLQNARNRSSQSGPFSSRKLSVNVTPGAIPAATAANTAVPFPGARPGDTFVVTFGTTFLGGIIYGGAICLVADVVQLRFANITAASVTQTVLVVTLEGRSSGA